MYLKLPYLIEKYKLKIRGVVHCGAHHAEEHEDYLAAGVKDIIYIEPAREAVAILQTKFENNPDVKIFPCAVSDTEGTQTLYCETVNTGQSNSLLKPKLHLEQFPSIVFDKTEEVIVKKLDNLKFDRIKYNFINADIQGNELAMMRGATETLPFIDYIYCEVNRDEVYEGCGQVGELDKFLKPFSFRRIETVWAGGGNWGDAIFLKI